MKVDREKVILGLKCHMRTCTDEGSAECPYWNDDECSEHLCRDALALIRGTDPGEETDTPHRVSEVVCLACEKRWVAVRPEGARLRDMECPACGRQGHVIETGEEIVDDGGQ